MKKKIVEINTADKFFTEDIKNEVKFNFKENLKDNFKKQKFLISLIICILCIVATGFAVSFASVTGYATVNKAIKLDIIGSSNDVSYSLGNVYQGEEVWSPKIKLINSANTNYKINFSVSVVSGNPSDVSFEIWDENKTSILTNPYELKNGYIYFYIKHKFSQTAELGNYTFILDIVPVQ
ncbi:MAG: hypothetical protein QXF15_00525 [Candidatus Aenigmatarchaeota archaeon]